MDKDKLNLFVPITKVDVEKRLVYGTVAEEIADKSGEIMDYATSKPEFEKWSADIAKATDGKSVGNMRVMHGNKVAGVFTSIAFDDGSKRVEMCGKVVDESEWQMVLAGGYSGFSMGGKYVKRWKDAEKPELTRYTGSPFEVSLVDNPCIPTATFEVVKADGSTEVRKFLSAGERDALNKTIEVETKPTNMAEDVVQGWQAKDGSFHATKSAAIKHNATVDGEAVAKAAAAPANDALASLKTALDKKAPELVTKAADDEDDEDDKDVDYADPGYQDDKKKRYPLDTEKHIRAAWSYIHQDQNQKPYTAAQVKKIKAAIVKAWKAKIDKDGPPSADADKTARVDGLRKNLWDVSRLAQILVDLKWMQEGLASEAAWEGDNSPAPQHLQALIDQLGAFLIALTTEEVGELSQSDDDTEYDGVEYEILELAAGGIPHGQLDALVKFAAAQAAKDGASNAMKRAASGLAKAGARHSKADMERVQKMHDTSVELGASCGDDDEEDDADKVARGGDLMKVTAERDALTKQLTDMAPQITALAKRVETLEAQPEAGGPVLRSHVVTKEADANGDAPSADAVAAFEKHMGSLTPDQRALALVKLSLRNPQTTSPAPLGKRQ